MLTKEEIIKEIQKLAKESNGKTPGEKKFYESTKVGIWDRMRYWPNYGEFVREAGLTPNKFDKTKYSHEQLCNLFIDAVRKKNKWPTRGELDVRHYNDSSFPNSGTFYSKLGLTKNLAKTILEFTKDKQGYSDIIDVCNSVREILRNSSKTLGKSLEEGKHGWVYLIKHGSRNEYRIGQTTDLLRRGRELKIQLPEKAILIFSIETVDPVGIETYWLNRFSPKRMNGDWFNLDRADVNEFKRWKRIV